MINNRKTTSLDEGSQVWNIGGGHSIYRHILNEMQVLNAEVAQAKLLACDSDTSKINN